MNPRAPLDPRLLEALSAYLDGRLEGAERMALEERLKRDEDLRRYLRELREVRDSLRSLPVLKSPRPLTLSPAQAGALSRRPAAFSPRSMAWGSALASFAFVVVLTLDVFSRGFFMMGAASQAAPEMTTMLQAPEAALADESQPVEGRSVAGAMATPSTAPGETMDLEPPTVMKAEATPRMVSKPTLGMTPTTAVIEDGCEVHLFANKAVDRCGETTSFTSETEQPAFSLPDFKTAAPYLEVFLGLTAVLLAVLAFILRRPR